MEDGGNLNVDDYILLVDADVDVEGLCVDMEDCVFSDVDDVIGI